ncbi:hypothetical protein [Enterococcus sp. AZ102]|uniref:hypothetical protein n=1 Tax=Enterococcus sp. AZ102 TaxID=2774865 RepID=UPI003F242B6D
MGNLFLRELNKYETTINEYDKKATYAIVTKKIFDQATDENELAILGMVAFHSHNEAIDNKIKVRGFKVDQLYDSLNLSFKNKKTYITKFENILHNLLHKEVLTTYKETNNSRYYINQEITDGFFQIGLDEIEKIIDSDEKVAMKIKMIADYMILCSGIWATKNFTDAKKFVNYMSLETIAGMRSSEVRSVSASIKKLIELNVISAYKIRFGRGVETKYVFSRYNYRSVLRNYVSQEIAKSNYKLVIDYAKIENEEERRQELLQNLGINTAEENDIIELESAKTEKVMEKVKDKTTNALSKFEQELSKYLQVDKLIYTKSLEKLIEKNSDNVLRNAFCELVRKEENFLNKMKAEKSLEHITNIIAKEMTEKFLLRANQKEKSKEAAERELDRIEKRESENTFDHFNYEWKVKGQPNKFKHIEDMVKKETEEYEQKIMKENGSDIDWDEIF